MDSAAPWTTSPVDHSAWITFHVISTDYNHYGRIKVHLHSKKTPVVFKILNLLF